MTSRFFVVAAVLAGTIAEPAAQAAPLEPAPAYRDASLPVDVRVEDLLRRLTLDEKIALVHGQTSFSTPDFPRLGVPRRWMSDGPHGVREDVVPDPFQAPGEHTNDFVTYLPAEIALAATWNPHLAYAYGTVIGQEARARGKDIMLGPGLNIQRTPLCGRNFEYLGEDPFLTSRLAAAYIQGAQAQGVSSTAKHFAANNQEWERGSIDAHVDERTLREIYLPAFHAAVTDGGVWSVMGAYNQLNGQHCCENEWLLNRVLKGEWGFRGLVMSDWGGVHDTAEAVNNGLDLEMGTDKGDADYLAEAFKTGVRKGEFPLARLDEKVRRNLRVMIATHVLDERPPGSINTTAHHETARRVAEEAIVLLKNDAGTLPLEAKAVHSILVVGDNAARKQAHGGWSSELKAFYEITPLDGILQRFGPQTSITYCQGYGKNVPAEAAQQAIAAAKNVDVVLFVGGLNHELGFDSEGADRSSLALPYGQDQLISSLVAANPKTIVALLCGAPVTLGDWAGRVPAILELWYPGMEGGNALARVLAGDVNPSGKLPCTFPRRLEDSPAHALSAYPGRDGKVTYLEKLLVGYRWFDTKQISPLFPFGYGLSYTSFAYSALDLKPDASRRGAWLAEVELVNTGRVAGAETVQVYVHQRRGPVERPEQELKAFRKVLLRAGERRRVVLPLGWDAFAAYDARAHRWIEPEGDYEVRIGGSSRDVRLRASFNPLPAPALKLASIFTDHTVLQRGRPLAIWGSAAPGDQVEVKFHGRSARTEADAAGRWKVVLPAMEADAKGAALRVSSPHGALALNDVVVGEVWVASGQSNMEWHIASAPHAAELIAHSNNPLVRQFAVEHGPAATEPVWAELPSSGWQPLTPATAGNFTAAGYYFAVEVQQKLGVPVGIIHSSWGGTPIESWIGDDPRGVTSMASKIETRWQEEMAKWPPQRVAAYPATMAHYQQVQKESEAKHVKNVLPWPGFPGTRESPMAPGGLFNAMIAPLAPFAVRGFLWYQGESNAGRPAEYGELLQTMIRDWRNRWGGDFLPFYVVQLPNYANNESPNGTDWAAFREVQASAIARVPATGLAVTIDVGGATNLHPPDKSAVGHRLALLALAHAYGQNLAAEGPVYAGLGREEHALRINFAHADGGLRVHGPQITSLQVAGDDKRFHAAEGRIEGESLVVSSAMVPRPIAVRYAWTNAPEANLYNRAGLPAVPFRSDSW